MPQGSDLRALGFKIFSLGIRDGAPLTVRSSIYYAGIQTVLSEGIQLSQRLVFVCLFCSREGKRKNNLIALYTGHHQPTSERALTLRVDDGSKLNAGFTAFAIFQGIQTSNAQKPYFVILQMGGIKTPAPPPSGSAHVRLWST